MARARVTGRTIQRMFTSTFEQECYKCSECAIRGRRARGRRPAATFLRRKFAKLAAQRARTCESVWAVAHDLPVAIDVNPFLPLVAKIAVLLRADDRYLLQ